MGDQFGEPIKGEEEEELDLLEMGWERQKQGLKASGE